MKEPESSHGQLLRSSFIVGGATVITIIIGLVRGKTVALLLGPAGFGLIGLYQSLMNLGATAAGLGLRTAGTRQIAEAVGRADGLAVAVARRALFWATMTLALVGGSVFWIARDTISSRLLDDPSLGTGVGMLGIGVALTVAAGSQTALLTGLRRIGDLSRVSVWSTIVAAVAGCGLVTAFGERGVIGFVLAPPACLFLLGYWRITKLKLAALSPAPISHMGRQWRTLATVGTPFMISALLSVGCEFFVRSSIQQQLGAAALGHFYASWTISATYVSLILGAIGADYYPRLTAIITDSTASRRLVNEQTEVVLLLAAPMILSIIGLAPALMRLLYSHEFAEASTVLRWQALGDVAMVVIWPLGYLLLATGRGLIYFWSEAIPLAVFTATVTLALPLFGVTAAGMAFLVMTLVHLALVHWLVRWRLGWFAWTRPVALHFCALTGAALGVFAASAYSDWLGAGIGVFAALVACVYSFRRFQGMVGEDDAARLVRLFSGVRQTLRWRQ